jgi:hypothetical protein
VTLRWRKLPSWRANGAMMIFDVVLDANGKVGGAMMSPASRGE